MNLYAELEIGKGATPVEIKQAYRRKVKRVHPDMNGGSNQTFNAVQLAYDVLSDAERREKYDRTGEIDESSVDKTEADAMNLCIAIVEGILASAAQSRVPPQQIDVIAEAVKMIDGRVAQLHREEEVIQRQIAERKALVGAFRAKRGKTNRIGPMLQASILALEAKKEATAKMREAPIRAKAILSEHSFEHSERPAQQFYATAWTG